MAISQQSRRAARFGVFELDLAAGELRKNGLRVRLQDQPFQLLSALVARPGEVVTREELKEKLWPSDTYVESTAASTPPPASSARPWATRPPAHDSSRPCRGGATAFWLRSKVSANSRLAGMTVQRLHPILPRMAASRPSQSPGPENANWFVGCGWRGPWLPLPHSRPWLSHSSISAVPDRYRSKHPCAGLPLRRLVLLMVSPSMPPVSPSHLMVGTSRTAPERAGCKSRISTATNRGLSTVPKELESRFGHRTVTSSGSLRAGNSGRSLCKAVRPSGFANCLRPSSAAQPGAWTASGSSSRPGLRISCMKFPPAAGPRTCSSCRMSPRGCQADRRQSGTPVSYPRRRARGSWCLRLSLAMGTPGWSKTWRLAAERSWGRGRILSIRPAVISSIRALVLRSNYGRCATTRFRW